MRLAFFGVILLVAAWSGAAGAASLAPLPRVERNTPDQLRSQRFTTDAARALMAGRYEQTIELAELALSVDPSNPWPHYLRGQALVALGRQPEAVAALDQAVFLFPPEEVWGRSVALYGRARALEEAADCEQAQDGYKAYADVVEQRSPSAARGARRVADNCVTPPG